MRGRLWFAAAEHGDQRGFSLLELLIVLAVTIALTAIMLPALSRVRDNANRIVCASNMRQVYTGLVLYYDAYDRLPYSMVTRQQGRLNELMAAHQMVRIAPPVPGEWDGVGLLFANGFCACRQCFYCPSHTGDNSLGALEAQWDNPDYRIIQTNVHYCGDVAWELAAHGKARLLPRRLEQGDKLVLLTDGMRTARDFNHQIGSNVLSGGGAVRWWSDSQRSIMKLLPTGEASDGDLSPLDRDEVYREIWERIADELN